MPDEQHRRIENQVLIHAPQSRVWKALTTPSQFAQWFHVTTEAKQFRVGQRIDLVSTYPGHEGTAFCFELMEISPEHRLVWRWKSGNEPYTSVVFELQEASDGTLVKVTESGFEQLSLEHRAKLFESNTRGWQIQTRNLRDYVEQNL